MQGPRSILGGLRIVELSAFVAAPLGGLTLAQLGADVIRVDPPGGNIDYERLPVDHRGHSLYWACLNRGKRSVEIDVRSAAGARLLRDLITAPGDGGGFFVTNLPVDETLGHEALAVRRPDVVTVRLTGSPDGTSAVDYTVNSAVGFPAITGDGHAGPVNHVLPAWDAVAGLTIATAVLAAERHRRLTGAGQSVRLALSDVAMAMAGNLAYLADVEVNGTERRPEGNQLYGAYGDSFRTADGRHAMVVAITDRQWQVLAATTGGGPALEGAARAAGYDLGNAAGRYAARELISAFLRPWFARRDLPAVATALTQGGVLWGPYRSFRQMLAEDPRCSEANPMFERVLHPGIGSLLTAKTPLDFSAVPRVPAGTAPRLGEHTDAVLQSVLGLDAATLAGLRAQGTIGGPRAGTAP